MHWGTGEASLERPEDIGCASAGLCIRAMTLLGFWSQPTSSGQACESPPPPKAVPVQLKQPRNLELTAVGTQLRPEQVAATEPPTRLEKNEARNTTAPVGRGEQEGSES